MVLECAITKIEVYKSSKDSRLGVFRQTTKATELPQSPLV